MQIFVTLTILAECAFLNGQDVTQGRQKAFARKVCLISKEL